MIRSLTNRRLPMLWACLILVVALSLILGALYQLVTPEAPNSWCPS